MSAPPDFKADDLLVDKKNSYENSLIDLENISFTLNGKSFAVGDFSCLPLPYLQKKVEKLGKKNDLGGLIYTYEGGDISNIINGIKEGDVAVVQAASQFNLLEMSSPSRVPEEGITRYVTDNTQGPCVALSSPAGTLFRNNAIYNGDKQTTDKQINTLITIMKDMNLTLLNEPKLDIARKGVYCYVNGYLYMNPETIPNAIQDIMDKELRVGIQWNTPSIVNPRIKLCQVYSSGLPFGRYFAAMINRESRKYIPQYMELIKPFAVALLASTFKCTLQAGVIHALTHGKRCTVYLTMVGGGVFENPHPWIQEGLVRALKDFKNSPLDVKMIYYSTIKNTAPTITEYIEETIDKAAGLQPAKGGRRTRKKRARRFKRTRRIKW